MHIQSGESTTLKRFTKLLVMTKRISTLPLVVPCKFPCHVEKAGEAVSDSKKPKSSGSDGPDANNAGRGRVFEPRSMTVSAAFPPAGALAPQL